jgi:hypothetical protein
MVDTVNKGYLLMVTGSEEDQWGNKLNADVFTIVDRNLGGLVVKTLENIQVDLSTTETQNLICRLSGVLTGNVLVTAVGLKGMMILENVTTGAFTVTFSNGVGSAITLLQGVRTLVCADATNGARAVANSQGEFPSGTRMLFHQTAAPTGWTKDVTAGLNDSALRLVTGTVGSGGSVAFATAFASQGVSGTVGNTTLTESQIPSHRHLMFSATGINTGAHDVPSATDNVGQWSQIGSNTNNYFASKNNSADATVGKTSATGSGQSHTHTFTGNAINLAVKYVDLIVASKN